MKRIVSFPHMGNYHVAFKTAAQLLGNEVLIPPKITQRTLELGTKYSPESVCIPFKYSIGNYIEVLEAGANVLVQSGGGCRLGYYAEVQAEILKKLGYEFEFVKLADNHNLFSVAHQIKLIHPQLSDFQIAKTLYLAYQKARTIDHIEPLVRLNIGFETQKGSFDRLFRNFLSALDRAETISQVFDIKQQYTADFTQLDINKPENPLRVGVVGEIYIVMEPFSNFFIEKELAQYGVEVHRFLTATGLLNHSLAEARHLRHLVAEGRPYIQHEIGGHGTSSVADAHRLAKQGFDGLIHVKPFGCMPEVNAMPALHKISQDYNFPILYFSFDSLTSETGIKTRLEAFYDMLVMKEAHHGRAG